MLKPIDCIVRSVLHIVKAQSISEKGLALLQDANDEYKLATGEQYGSTSGKYYVGARERSMPREAHDAAIRARLWQTLEEQTGFTYPSSL